MIATTNKQSNEAMQDGLNAWLVDNKQELAKSWQKQVDAAIKRLADRAPETEAQS